MISSSDPAPSNITGAIVITSPSTYATFIFNQWVFYCNGVDPMFRYDRSAATVVLAGFVGPGGADSLLRNGTGFNSRIYLAQNNTTSYWYAAGAPGLLAITGALTQVDLSGVFEIPAPIAGLGTWTLNQGLENQELFVVASTQGEILVYAGDNPGATNWQLIAKAKIAQIQARNPFVRFGGELYVITLRGLIAMSTVISGKQSEAAYASISRKIKDQLTPLEPPTISTDQPFLAAIGVERTSVYLMNYERGAWSRLVFNNVATPTGGINIQSIAWIGSTLVIGDTSGDVWRCLVSEALGSTTFSVWRSGFNDFGGAQLKSVKFAKVQGRNLTTGQSFRVRGGIEADFQPVANPPTAPTDSAAGNSATAPNTCEVHLNLGNIGKRISPFTYRVGGTTGQNEIQGIDLYFEDGGYL
jgi:hypothetical protein